MFTVISKLCSDCCTACSCNVTSLVPECSSTEKLSVDTMASVTVCEVNADCKIPHAYPGMADGSSDVTVADAAETTADLAEKMSVLTDGDINECVSGVVVIPPKIANEVSRNNPASNC